MTNDESILIEEEYSINKKTTERGGLQEKS